LRMNEKEYPWPVEYYKNCGYFYPWFMHEDPFHPIPKHMNEIEK
jgi:hypothetical protein